MLTPALQAKTRLNSDAHLRWMRLGTFEATPRLTTVPAFNQVVKDQNTPPIVIKPPTVRTPLACLHADACVPIYKPN
jgi:hypothetical protein